ncbi:InlB B-repeat-containing protein [Paenibacillus daejeonensis]|uniref:InlB B-repeat-containing protein n=1 Tax=Paenibacillus daejeonensis TaxID=135193 RepID=UPI0003AAE57A|nr:InlB B-repeat-containing protein [Paenibacillus daejeonensis]
MRNKKMNSIVVWLIIATMLSGMLPTQVLAAPPAAQLNGLNNYVVELSSDASTSARPASLGTATDDGRIWADKSVFVNETDFDVTLSALAQEYIRTSTGVVRQQAAADVAMVLDMSQSMNNNDRITNMKNAVNKAIDMIMAANPRNRIGIYYYGASNNVGTLFPLASYSTPQTGDSATVTDRYITSSSTTITRKAGVTQTFLDGDTETTTEQTVSTSPATATQLGLYTAVDALKNDITGRTPSSQDTERVPYVLLLTDGEANNAYTNWYNSPPNGTQRSGSGANGTAEIAALTILSAAKLKDELKTAYSAHSAGKDVVWFNVAFGLDEGNTLATALLKPITLSSASTGVLSSVRTQLNTLTTSAPGGNNKYGINGTPGYVYADEYIYFVSLNDLGKVDEALGDLAALVEAATNEKIIPFEQTSADGQPLNLVLTDVLGEGMELKTTPSMGALTGTVKSTSGTVTIYEFPDMITTVEYNSATREIKWIIRPDEVPLIMFSDRQNPTPGQYSNANLPPVQLTYTVGLAETYDSGTFYSNEYVASTATAHFIPNVDNKYYYENISESNGVISSTPKVISGNTLASEPKSSNITNTAAEVYTHQWSSDNDGSFITKLGNNGKIAPKLKIEIAPASDSVPAGEKAVYHITVTNLTDNAIANVVVNDDLPVDLTFVGGSITEDGDAKPSATFPYVISSVPANSTTVLTYEATVPSSATAGTEYLNGATITSVSGTGLTTPAAATSDKVTVTDTFSPSVTLLLDGASYPDQTVELWKDGTRHHTLAASGNIHSAGSVTPGTYDIYVNDEDTGVQLSGTNATIEINYYSVAFYDGTQKYDVPAAQTILAGGQATLPTAPTKQGYTFDTWVTTDGGSTAFNFQTQIISTTALYATWTPNTGTAYTVNHHQAAIDGTYSADPAVQNLSGTTGELTSAEAQTYPGFTAVAFTQETIAPDGSTVVDIYYTRNLYDITFVIDPTKGTTTDATETQVLFGVTPTAPSITDKPGYAFTGWNPAVVPVIGDDTYTAQFDLTDFAITYNLDGGTVANTNPDMYTVESEDLTLNNPTRVGYNFAGWTGTDLTDPTMTVTITKGSIGARSYTASWVPSIDTAYTVHHYQAAIDGTYSADPAVQNLSGTTGELTSAEAQTYSGFTAVAFTQETIAPDGSTVVDIYYTRNLYDITFVIDPSKGTTTDDTAAQVLFGVTPTAPSITDKPGYAFTGWNPAVVPVIGDDTYTAQFDLTDFAITYNLDGGTVANTNPDTYTVESEDLTLNNPTRVGYTFAGWTGTDLTDPTMTVTITKGSTGARGYTASWTPNTGTAYTVHHYQASIDGGYAAPVVQNLSGTTGELTSAEAQTYPGFTAVAFTQETIAPDGSTVVDIYYTRNLYDITFVIDPAKGSTTGNTALQVVYQATPIAPSITNEPGYAFTGWDKTIEPVAINETYTAQFDVIDYTINYSLDSGTVHPANPTIFTVESDEFTLTNPTKPGYTFAGWTGTGLSEQAQTVTVEQGSIGNRSYTATWTAMTSTVTLDDNGGSGGSGSVTATYDQPMPAATTPSRAGYTFLGYFDHTGNDAIKYYNENMSSERNWDKTDASTTLYAVWTEIDHVTIQYAVNHADYGTVSQTYESLNPENGTATGSVATANPGYYFVEWQNANGESVSTSVSFDPQKEDSGSYVAATYTAVFAAEIYTITYDLDAWTVDPLNPATYTVESEDFTLTNPTKAGYTFAGWTGTGLSEPTLTVTVAKGSTGDRSYTATWTAVQATGDYIVIGTVIDDSTPPVNLPGATVKIVKGNTQYGNTATTDAAGHFTIHDVPAGTYNLTITLGEKTAIIAIVVGGVEQVVDLGNVIFPYNASSALKLQGSGTPPIVIDNLHPESVDYLLHEYGNTGFTRVEMIIEKVDETTNDADILDAMMKINTNARNNNTTIGLYLDMIIEKFYRVTEADNWNSEGLIEQTNGLIKVMIPIPAELQGKSSYTVYRYHGNEVNVIRTVANADGEYLTLDSSDWTLTLYVKNFSVYGIAYPNASAPPVTQNPPVTGEATKFTITFDVDGGTQAPAAQSVVGGELLTKPADPIRAGYTFAGWYQADGTEWNFGTDKVDSNLTLTAKWTPAIDKDNHFAYMQGYPDVTFAPQKNMTRAEVTVMFARLLVEKMDINQTYPSQFKDVDPVRWYANAIGYMEQFGIITGYADGSFRPDATITRAEFAAIASRFDKLVTGEPITFTDIPENYWARDYIASAAAKGWIQGYPDGTFKPGNYITRAEVVSLVNRMLERSADRSYVDLNKAQLNQYVDLTNVHWAYYDIMEATNRHDYEKNADSETWISHTK